MYGKKPLGVLGGDQMPVRSGVESDTCCGSARSPEVKYGNSPSGKASTDAAARIERIEDHLIRKTLSFRIHSPLENFMFLGTVC